MGSQISSSLVVEELTTLTELQLITKPLRVRVNVGDT